MKRFYLLLILSLVVQYVQAQIVTIPDINFKNALLNHTPVIDINGDGEIQVSEAESFTGHIEVSFKEINTLEGIESFVNLERLSCHINNLTELDISQNTALIELHCEHNNLTYLDLSQNPSLEVFSCHKNFLTNLDFSQNPNLKTVQCSDNLITSLDLSINPNLERLYCRVNDLSFLNIKNGNNLLLDYLDARLNPELVCIEVDDVNYANSQECAGSGDGWCVDQNVQFSEDCLSTYVLNIPDANFKSALVSMNCVDTNGDGQGDSDADTSNDGEIQLGEAVSVLNLHISNNGISSLAGIEYFINLEYIDCSLNLLTSINLSNNLELKYLWCGANQLVELDVTNNHNLVALGCSSNQLSKLRLDNSPGLKFLQCQHNQLRSLSVANGNNTILERLWAFNNPDLYCIRVDDVNDANSRICDQGNNTGWCKDIDSEYCDAILSIPDANFKSLLINSHIADLGNGYEEDVDTNDDGEIQYYEAEEVIGLDFTGYYYNIITLQGIEGFINLLYLDCHHQNIISLDLAHNVLLETLKCYDNSITNLNISQNTQLEVLWCHQNQLSSLDVSENINLYQLECWQNNIAELDVTQNTMLRELDLGDNNVSSLDVSQNVLLERLFCLNNNLAHLDITQNPLINYLWCSGNSLTVLDMRNGGNAGIESFNARLNPGLTCIQVDDEAYANAQPNCFWPGIGWCIDQAISSYSENCGYPIIDIPDVNFKNALINTLCIDLNDDGILDVDADTNNDDEIQFHEVKYVTNLNVAANNILSLVGIEYFPHLIMLECQVNQLITLDVSENSNLEKLDCYSNNLLGLNIANDNNTNMARMFAFDNYNLTCIQVDDENYANSLPNCQGPIGWCVSATTSYSESCVWSIDDEVLNAIAIYPNPAKNVLYIRSQKPIENIKIYSLHGVLVIEQFNTSEIELLGLPTGVYFIQLSVQGETTTRKFIKQ